MSKLIKQRKEIKKNYPDHQHEDKIEVSLDDDVSKIYDWIPLTSGIYIYIYIYRRFKEMRELPHCVATLSLVIRQRGKRKEKNPTLPDGWGKWKG